MFITPSYALAKAYELEDLLLDAEYAAQPVYVASRILFATNCLKYEQPTLKAICAAEDVANQIYWLGQH